MYTYSTRSATLPPARTRLALSPSLSVLRGMRYCQPALPTVQRASTESIPRCHHHLQVDLNQIAGPLVLRLVSVLSALPVSARLLPVDDPVVRRNLRDTPLVQPQEHHLLHLEGAHARPHVADEQSESRKVSLSLAARGLDPVVKACEECEMRHGRFLDNLARRLRKLRGAPSPPKPRQGKSVLFQLHSFCYIPRQLLENAYHVVCSRVSCALGSASQPPTIIGISTTLFRRSVPGRVQSRASRRFWSVLHLWLRSALCTNPTHIPTIP